jgi:hypothetical protein
VSHRSSKPLPRAASLRHVHAKLIRQVRDYLVDEVDACHGGIAPEQAPVFDALVAVCERELARRRRAARP